MPHTLENKEYTALLSGENATVLDAYAFPEKDASKAQTEADMEQEFIETLVSQSYEYAAHIKTEDDLKANLRLQLEKLNEVSFSEKEWNFLWKTHISNPSEDMRVKTKKMQVDWYIVNMKMDNGESKNIAFLNKKYIHKNHLQVINQYRTQKTVWKRGHRYDVTILVNGFPMIHIELKNHTKLQEAFRQIDRYSSESFSGGAELFEYVQIFVISNGVETKYYSNTTREAHTKQGKKKNDIGSFQFTSYWTDANNKRITHLYHFTRTFFARNALLKILLKYSVFDVKGNLKIMRPYQIVATEKILVTVRTTLNKPQLKRAGKKDAGGYIWHTTGSGKTLTSFKTATLVQEFPDIHKVLFVVDRKDLDTQTIEEFNNFQNGAVSHNTSTRELARTLSSTDTSKKIVVTTIQKLDHFLKQNASHPLYGEHVVIVFDECHRSQFGNMHQNITKKFKKYHIFGFTGTPIFGTNSKPQQKISRAELWDDFVKNKIVEHRFSTTDQLFWERLHTYTITHAIADGNVLPFRMEVVHNIKKKEYIAEKEVLQIDRGSALTDWQRLESIGQYILDNFDIKTNRSEKNYTQENRLNALFAVESIDTAKLYYKTFTKLQAKKEEKKRLKIGIIYSYAPKSYEMDSSLEEEVVEDASHLPPEDRTFLIQAIDDYNSMFGTKFHIERFDNYYSDVCKRLKSVELDMVIVVNMLLTGFDAHRLNTLFVDKNLEYHGLIQAFSRTNRLFNESKDVGNIVCFRPHLEEDAKRAVEMFGNTDSRGLVIAPPFQETFAHYEELVTEIRAKFPYMRVGGIAGEEAQAFVKLFWKILKVNNFLRGYTEFIGKDPLQEWEKQSYKGKYLTLAEEYKENNSKEEKEKINNDLVFEVELIKQYDIDMNFILETIGKSDFSTTFAVQIKEQLGASPELRSKTELIDEFIESLRSKKIPAELVPDEWDIFIRTKYADTLNQLVKKEALKEKETYEYLKRAFENDTFQEHGTGVDELFLKHTAHDFFATPDQDRSMKLKEKLRNIFEYFRKILTRKSGE